MKNLFFTVGISLAMFSTASAQSEFLPRVTEKGHYINQYDKHGEKHGYWEAYVNEHLKLVKKKNQAAFIVMVYFDHGENLWEGIYFDHSRNFRLTEPLPEFEYGSPKFLTGHFSFETKSYKTTKWLRYDFTKGYPDLFLSEFDVFLTKYDSKYFGDKTSYIYRWDFTKQLNDDEGTYQFISYANGIIESASWFRKIYLDWDYYNTCGLCSEFTDTTITLNNQTWSSANLNVYNFRNGDNIFFAQNPEEFEQCEEENIPACSKFKGQMVYNWHAINDPRGLAPEGWRLANDQDFIDLRQFLGANHVDFLLSSYSKDEKATLGSNCSGFNASNIDYAGPWWSVDMEDSETAHSWIIYDEALTYILEPHDTFYAVRLIKE